MVVLTADVIRRKAEHNDGILADLIELSLHQMEIEKIEVISTVCRKLQILYLQNNIISKIENLHHLKDLRYLNMALNNITVIEGLRQCEFLNKLDLTANFVDVDTLEESLEHLKPLLHLKELFCMGCMFQGTEEEPTFDHRAYVIAMLPQLQTYDGKDIVRSERIKAAQDFASLREQLRGLANAKRLSKGLEPKDYAAVVEEGDEDLSPWTPEERTKMYREMAEQKEEQERSKDHLKPRTRDYEVEHEAAKARALEREARGEIRQCNEGRWAFTMNDEDGEGNVVVTVPLPKFLDTSLLHVDAHPSYVTIVIKGKVLRLRFPEEVNSDAGTAKRSAVSGELVLTLPKVVKPRRLGGGTRTIGAADAKANPGPGSAPGGGRDARPTASLIRHENKAQITARTRRLDAPQKVGDAMLEAAAAAGGGASGVPALEEGRRAPRGPVDASEVPPLE